jgi:hypothetical protein
MRIWCPGSSPTRQGPDAPRSARRCRAYRRGCCRSGQTCARTGIGDGPTYFTILLLLYLDRCSVRVRIHGRPRSDRKRRFLLSAVGLSTNSRHPREAMPTNWAQRGGLASGREMSPDAEATFHRASCTRGNQVVDAPDGAPFRQGRRPTRVCRTPRAGGGSAC